MSPSLSTASSPRRTATSSCWWWMMARPTPPPQILAGIEDPRLRVLPVPHAGFCRALEAGVNAARGT